MSVQVQNDPIIFLGNKHIHGFLVSNDVVNPQTQLDLSFGSCRDENNIIDITWGPFDPNIDGISQNSQLKLNIAVLGAGGVDALPVSTSIMYSVYVIADSRYIKPTAAMISLASNAIPLMPTGYDCYRKVGYCSVDSNSQFLLAVTHGSGAARELVYLQMQSSATTNGSSPTLTNIGLSRLVPPVNNILVNMQAIWINYTAPSTLSYGLFFPTGNYSSNSVLANYTNTPVIFYNQVPAQLFNGQADINYSVSSGGVGFFVAGFKFSV